MRGVFLFICTLCVTAWVGSYWRTVVVVYDNKDEYSAGLRWGRIVVEWWYTAPGVPTMRMVGRLAEDWSGYAPANSGWMGFVTYAAVWKGTPSYRLITVPLWCPTLLCCGLLWLVWRKTRLRGAGRAFPVEVGTAMTRKVRT